MSGPGSIVRFVDVVLILLFGFISISVIKGSPLELISSSEAQPLSVDAREVVHVAVLADGSFLVQDESILVSEIAELKRYIATKRRTLETEHVVVRIRSSKDASVLRVLEVVTLCQELGVENALEVELTTPNAPGDA